MKTCIFGDKRTGSIGYATLIAMLQYQTIPVTAFQQNCSLVWCDETRQAAIIDPGGDLDLLLDTITQLKVNLEQIWITHGHLDHAGATADLAERLHLPIIGPHPGDQFWIDGLPVAAATYGFAPARAFTPTRWLHDGDTVSLGAFTFQVRHCPGHTPGHVVFYSPDIATKVTQSVELSDEFRGALADGQFVLHYQPIINLADGRLCKAEALIRWNHPQKGLLYPGEFIAMAEERGHLIVMTKWVLAEAAGQVRQWRDAIDPGFQISVNIPPLFLKACMEQGESLVAYMEGLNVPRSSLILEITENAFLNVDDDVLELLSNLQALGFLHAMDDFGVG